MLGYLTVTESLAFIVILNKEEILVTFVTRLFNSVSRVTILSILLLLLPLLLLHGHHKRHAP